MRSFLDAKNIAKTLQASLAERKVEVSHSESLELVAKQFEFRDWNTMSAKIKAETSTDGIDFARTCPLMRIFDEEKAKEFYVDFLGFTLDWEHRFGDNFPLYCQVSRGGLYLHLTGHSGDATPGNTIWVLMRGIRDYHKELHAKQYKHMKPGIEEAPWGLEMTVIDPFNNHIRFCEQ
ncbi:glyoxalase superfamily protein [Lacibacterium aquatile]|uniref:Bleomycin resistance protein n=1 Tax=Lacibacterium aquatile TaxID=1168082 RepID=A0ABW5DQH7_9PROT